MTERVKEYLSILKKKEYRKNRMKSELDISPLVEHFSISDPRLNLVRFEQLITREIPVLHPNDMFGFHRHQANLPFYTLHDGSASSLGGHGNITPNYARLIGRGLDATEQEIVEYRKKTDDPQKHIFYDSILAHFTLMRDLIEKYRVAAKERKCERLAKALERIPFLPATDFYEACLFLHILIFFLRCSPHAHLTLGRFDQYMYPYYQKDIEKGVSQESLLETLECFFITLNLDSDLYSGVQQGDNGQSMVLGGFDRNGDSMFNELSQLCMDASMELSLIDPKINLRCGKNTPQELFELGTKMTKLGMGFPQYCNDDVVVPALVSLGYDYEDALDYTVAACWEFIVPNCAFDVPNIATFNFPLVVNRAIHRGLLQSATFDALMRYVHEEIEAECEKIAQETTYKKRCTPLLAVLVDGCLEKGMDIMQYAPKYNNYGCHGAGISNAADALAAIKDLIFNQQSVSKETLLEALHANFEGYTELRNTLLDCPKMGQDNDFVDAIASELLDVFSKSLSGRKNAHGGFWRVGTGSAMEYILSAKKCPATADGRLAFTPYGCSFSPSIISRPRGPISVIHSFTKYDMKKAINGGPLTLELHDSVFRNEDGERKVAQLVRYFIDRGGHQLQLNAVNRDLLLNAQKHPEDYPNLIVRVWGWSGYFCELDPEYQNHIIARTEFQV
ncbi:MAG: pyruvate formate-lyase [Ruminococcaceae bacterium]|nr:pyruvate formate-lyase [Oscillospiraceae bacterium]